MEPQLTSITYLRYTSGYLRYPPALCLICPTRKHLKRGVEMVQQFPTPDFGARLQGLLTPKAVVVVDTTPHKAVTCGGLELSCAIVEDATKKWCYMALPCATVWAFERTGCRASLQIATCALEQSTSGSPTRDRRLQGRLVDGHGPHGWQNGRASREKVVRKSWESREQASRLPLICHMICHSVGSSFDADRRWGWDKCRFGESDSRDVERRCLKHTHGCIIPYHTLAFDAWRRAGL